MRKEFRISVVLISLILMLSLPFFGKIHFGLDLKLAQMPFKGIILAILLSGLTTVIEIGLLARISPTTLEYVTQMLDRSSYLLLIPIIFLEELFYRALILNTLLDFGAGPAIMISSLMFSIGHVSLELKREMAIHTATVFVDSIVLGVLFLLFNSLMVSFFGHLAGNLFGLYILSKKIAAKEDNRKL